MLVAEDVYGINDYLILPKGTELTNYSITRLKFYSITDISIAITEDGEVHTVETSIPEIETVPDSYSEFIKGTPEFIKFKSAFQDCASSLKTTLSGLYHNLGKPLNQTTLLNETRNILSESRNGTHVFHMLHCMRDNDDVTYAHSVNVALICNVFGKWLKLSDEDIQVLTLCGLLHDVGKVKVPAGIISKPNSLTKGEYSVIQNHPIDGYELLDKENLDERIKYAAIMHHERCDGSGYPHQLSSKQIDEFAKIVAIADIYDAMTSSRVYRAPLCPFDVINIFQEEGLQKYDPHYLLTFLEGIVNTYVNCTVRLSDGRVGDIIMIDVNNLSRPVVKIGASFVDLAKNKDLSIIAII